MKRIRHILVLFMLFMPGLAFVPTATAQWSYQVGLDASRDSNPLGLNGASEGSAVTLTGGAEYYGALAGGGYIARMTRYDEPTDLNAYLHQGYFNIGTDRTNVSLLAEQRLGTDSDLYDYAVLKSSAGHYFGCAGFRCTLSATGSVFDFSQLTDRNQASIGSALRLSRFFQTRTTLIGTAATAYTRYTDLPLEPSGAEPDRDVTQLTLGLRLAQSLTPTTGAATYYRRRFLGGASSAAIIDQTSGTSYALLDDPSLYNTSVIGFEVTQMLNDYTISIKIGGSFERRDYPSQGIYLDTGAYDMETLREDEHASIWMQADWTVAFGSRSVTFEVAAQWSDNTSNSYWYDYSSSYLSLGLKYGL
jgi:hypothetical protein